MTALFTIGGTKSNKYAAPFYLALIVAGLAGNYFKLPLFFSVDFLFGSIFSMLALQFFGFGRGVLAAAIIAGYTFVLWNHPYAIIIMTAETAVVGWLMCRKKMTLLTADAVFWIVIGMPLVCLFYYAVMKIPIHNTVIIMTKQTVNGLANALIARLLFTGYTLRTHAQLLSFREIISNMLAFFVLCPALIMLAIGSRTDFAETDSDIRALLIKDSQRLTDIIENWVESRKLPIENLAGLAATLSPAQIQPRLELVKTSDVNFLRIGLVDKDATITANFPPVDELDHNNIGKNFADRRFIPILKQTHKPMLSEVVMGRIGTPKPMVTMLAPVIKAGAYEGYVTGILNFDQIKMILDKSFDDKEMLYTLVDKNGNVIITNQHNQKVMQPFSHISGTLNRSPEGIFQWIPALPPSTPPTERWQKSYYVAESTIGNLAEWKLILEQPVAPFQKALYNRYSVRFTSLFMLLLGMLGLAIYVSHQLVSTTEKLRKLTGDLPARLVSDSPAIDWPQTTIAETNHLIGSFQEMSTAIQKYVIELKLLNDSLEQRVADRTQELQKSEEELRQAKESAESATATKSRFLATVAHEFRTPLSLLTGSVDILERYWERLDSEQRTEYYEHVRSASRQISSLIDSVLSFNRFGANVSATSRTPVEVGSTCQTIAEEVKTVWDDGHNVTISIPSDCGSVILNEILLRQILVNLLTNAFRYTPAGGTISLCISHEKSRLLIDISDSGIGIPEEDLHQIFNAFYRGRNVEGRRGLGLGLSIVHEALSQMSGSIDINSKTGEGTIIRVEIPVFDEPVSKERQS